ncbi:SDR family oxidoreductase [Melittangium boletus]|uniref:Short-chain dehydrogenase/reductase n=1 Tax=Melittangium boletus DSM 14713 TaxID=1294270 RepID=A0A250IAL9_9BACT|nr:SDR family oxidoreductase [Melittangium boletus]ATB28201.1 short-chain dehydrogenase/reductase [Melittangium boletus DSM 14713]
MKRTVLITGCSTGFGLASAQHFAAQGWNVIATMRTPSADSALAVLPNVLVTRLDVQDRASIDSALKAGIERFGGLDVVVNNAGFGLHGLFEPTPREKILEQFEVNVFGVMDVIRAALPHLEQRGGGTIVNVSSGAGIFTLPLLSLYCASKFALEGFSEALSYELTSQNVRVRIVEPGGVLDSRFVSRSAEEQSRTAVPARYRAFVHATEGVFAGLRDNRSGATSEDVARVIYEAATDTSDRLRYVATDGIKQLVKMRRETSEDAYLTFMREHFLARPPSAKEPAKD